MYKYDSLTLLCSLINITCHFSSCTKFDRKVNSYLVMFPFLLCFKRCSWDDYYKDTIEPTITTLGNTTNPQKTQHIPTASTVYIYNSAFAECSSSSYGGAISYSISNGKILIEFSTFSSCSTTKYGGGVYAYGCSDCLTNCVCSYNCFTKDRGQFIYTNSITNKNYIHQSSVCSNGDKSEGYAPIYLYKGEQQIQSVNISNNYVSRFSAYLCNYCSPTHQVTYCSIINNTTESDVCVCHDLYGSGSCSIISSNINNNNQNTTKWGTIVYQRDIEIKDCCIIGNSGPSNWYLFRTWNTITIINCTLPCSYSIYTLTGTIITNNAKPFSSFINKLKLTEKEGYCSGEYDSIKLPYCPMDRTQRGPHIYRERKQILF